MTTLKREQWSIALERKMRRWGGGPGLLGYTVVAVVVGVALLLYFLGAHTNAANGGSISKRGTGFVLGEVTGITAAVLLAVVVVLASRRAILELLFGDLTKVYVAHGVLGMLMFAVVSFHPIMYTVGGLLIGSSFVKASQVTVPFHVVVLDWISYIAIAVALIPTMYMRLSFDWWRGIHLLLGVAMILTGYSILIDNSAFDTAALPGLRIYLFVLYGLGTIAFVWVALVQRLAEPKREYRIVGAEYHPEANAVELRGVPVGRPARFRAGQFTYVDLVDSLAQVHREFEAHPFSIASCPSKDEITLVVEGAGAHTARIQEVAASHEARALLHGSYGRLVVGRPERKKQLWLAGGIGITPFAAMAEEMAADPDQYQDYDVVLIVGVEHADQAFMLDRLLEHAGVHRGLQVHVWNSEERGLPTAQAIAETFVEDIRDRAVMISGPPVMISELTRELREMGLSRGQIRSEVAIGPPGRWRVASPALRYTRTGVTLFFAAFVVVVIVSIIANAIG